MELNAVCYLTRQFDEPWTWENYLRVGGYEAWRRILAEKIPPETVIEQVKASGLRARRRRISHRNEVEFHAAQCGGAAVRRLQFGRERALAPARTATFCASIRTA